MSKKGRKALEGGFSAVATEKVLEALQNSDKPLKVKEIASQIVASGEYPDAESSIQLHCYKALNALYSASKVTAQTDETATSKRKPKVYSIA